MYCALDENLYAITYTCDIDKQPTAWYMGFFVYIHLYMVFESKMISSSTVASVRWLLIGERSLSRDILKSPITNMVFSLV